AIHNANHAVITSAAIGSTVHDSATVTGTQAGGTPTGTVTFTVYSSADCSTGGVAGTPVALNGSGVADPSQTAVQSVGGISLTAHYNGSTTYNESTSSCEQLTLSLHDALPISAIHNANHAVITSAAIGSTV